MKKILNIVLGEISTGELGIAISFVKQQSKEKYENYFIIPEDKVKILERNEEYQVFSISKEHSPTENQLRIKNYIKNGNFSLIILFDAFTLEYSQNWTGFNFSMLKDMGIPIASLDEYEYTKAGYKLDYYGIFIKRLPALLEQCDYVIKNCPLSIPQLGTDGLFSGEKGNDFYYRVFHSLMIMDNDKREYIRRKYIGSERQNKKMVFFTTSMWEVAGAYSFDCQNRLVTWLGVILHEYLKELNEEIVLLHIGAERWVIQERDEFVDYIHYDSLPVDEFEALLQCADLFVTFNTVSITLSKAIMFGIPSLVLNNSKIIDFSRLEKVLKERPIWYQNMAEDVKKIYPFTASMFGWSNFLQVVLKGNPYIDSFQRIDMFNYNKTKDMLQKVLMNEELRSSMKEKCAEFSKIYLEIYDAETILDAMLQSNV